MSTTDFKKVLLKDARLMVTDSVNYAVVKGGSNMTCAQFTAVGGPNFTSTINFNVAVPSQETIISRNALIRVTLEYTLEAATVVIANAAASVAGSGYLFNYGGVDSFGPFPFTQMINSQQWTINNTTVSQTTRDILAIMLRIQDKRWLARYNGMTPTMFDSYFNASALVGTVLNNPASSFQSMSLDNELIPRGAFPLAAQACTLTATGAVSTNFLAAGTSRKLTFSITVTEPVMISPFVFAGDDSCGMYGVQNIIAIYNLDTTCNTAIRLGGSPAARWATGVAPVPVFSKATSPQLLLEFLTPHPSDLMPSRNVLGNYYELPRYITSVGQTIAAATGTATVGQTVTVSSQSIQLNQIPDKLYICVSKPVATRVCTDSDSFLPISGITIQFNNSAGILSSATQQDLWRMSVENGVNQSWLEFSGYAQGAPNPALVGTSAVQFGGIPIIPTCGSVLVLEFGKDIELKNDYYAPGSLGQFNLQFNLTFNNNTGADIAVGAYQILLMVQNSGVFSLERGVCSSYLGILTKADVLEASRQVPHSYRDAVRLVGGGECPSMLKRLAGVLGKVESKGMGQSGGGQSGGKKHDKDRSMGSLEDRLR
jgi:hypothetical protein